MATAKKVAAYDMVFALAMTTIFVLLMVGLGISCGKIRLAEAEANKTMDLVQEWILPKGVQEFYLEDGTKCVLYDAVGGGGAITCDWR